jgi:hypothetical protein
MRQYGNHPDCRCALAGDRLRGVEDGEGGEHFERGGEVAASHPHIWAAIMIATIASGARHDET